MSTIGSTAIAGSVALSLRRTRPDIAGTVFQVLLLLSLLFSLAVLAVLITDVLVTAMPVFQSRGVDFLTSPLSSDPSKAGIAQGLFGTFMIAVLVAVFAFPIGIATAIYLEEYAPDNALTRFINVNIRNLAGVPSVVYGLLGLTVFVAFFAAVGAGKRAQPVGCHDDAGRPRPADRDHHLFRGAAGGPQCDSARRDTASAPHVGR